MGRKADLTNIIANYNLLAGVGKTAVLVEDLKRYVENECDRARDEGWAAGEMEATRRSLRNC